MTDSLGQQAANTKLWSTLDNANDVCYTVSNSLSAHLKQRPGLKVKVFDIARHGHHKGAQVHGAHQAASHVPALYLPCFPAVAGTHLPTPRG